MRRARYDGSDSQGQDTKNTARGNREVIPQKNRLERIIDPVLEFAQAIEKKLAYFEKKEGLAPGARELVRKARETVQLIRAETNQWLLIVELEYDGEILFAKKERLTKAFTDDDEKYRELMSNPKLSDRNIEKIMQKEAELESGEAQSVTTIVQEMETKGIMINLSAISVEENELYIKRLLRAYALRKAEFEKAVIDVAQNSIVLSLAKGRYDTNKDPLETAQQEFDAYMQKEGLEGVASFPPDIPFRYGYFVKTNADRMDQLRAFLVEQKRSAI